MAAVFASAFVGSGWDGRVAVPAYAIGSAVLLLGLVLLVFAAATLRTSLTPFPAPRARAELVTTGAYALVRHPMYGGGILVALGWSILFASLVGLGFALVLVIFLDLKARREEAWLSERLPGYDAYRLRTRRRLLPFVY
jgi:protein-S-isoprenylcysteine O-methyltransferase Ste14